MLFKKWIIAKKGRWGSSLYDTLLTHNRGGTANEAEGSLLTEGMNELMTLKED